jgi:hypothetical protein
MAGRIALLAALVTVMWAAPAGAQMPGGAPQAPAGALHRYTSPSTGTHWVTPGPVTGDFSYEFTLGYLYMTPASGLDAIYGCRAGSADYFLSHDAACEGQAVLGLYGGLTRAPAAAVGAAVPLLVAGRRLALRLQRRGLRGPDA